MDRSSPSSAACRRLAQALWHEGRHSEAYLTVLAGLRRAPSARLHFQAALFYAFEQRYEQAQAHLLSAAQLHPGDADVMRHLGLVAAAMGRTASACRHLQRALRLRPGDLTLAHELAVAARAARMQGQQVTALPPATTDAAAPPYRLRRDLAGDGDVIDTLLDSPLQPDRPTLDLMRQQLSRAIGSSPRRCDLRLRYSRVLDRLDMPAAALRQARKAVTLNGRFVQAHLHLARLYERSGHLERAVQAVLRAIACGGDWADVHCMAADLLKRTRRLEGARSHLQRALRLNPALERARQGLNSLAA